MTATFQRTHFEDLGDFYRERGGADSGESDFGAWWKHYFRQPGFHYRVSVVHSTGDVYASGRQVLLLGQVPSNGLKLCMPWITCLGSPIAKGKPCAYYEADRLLEGWVDAMHDESLAWVRRQLGTAIRAFEQ